MAGTVGAIFNGALQFGSAIGLAAISSVETSVEASHGGVQEYNGRAAAFWFLFGVVLAEILSVLCFYRSTTDRDQKSTTSDNNAVAASGEKVSIPCDSSSPVVKLEETST